MFQDKMEWCNYVFWCVECPVNCVDCGTDGLCVTCVAKMVPSTDKLSCESKLAISQKCERRKIIIILIFR